MKGWFKVDGGNGYPVERVENDDAALISRTLCRVALIITVGVFTLSFVEGMLSRFLGGENERDA